MKGMGQRSRLDRRALADSSVRIRTAVY